MPKPKELRIRMYRIGFGDFFLISIPDPKDDYQHIIVDCGVVTGHTGKGDIGTIKSAIEHMEAEINKTSGRIALIIVTHRHKDHIIGFSRREDVFLRFKGKVDAIWMPLWEAENAKGFQADLQKIAIDIHQVALALGADEEILDYMENAIGFDVSDGPGGGTNGRSLEILKTELGVAPRYYGRGDKPKLPDSLSAIGLAAEILSPPPLDESEFLKLEDLKQGVGGQYLDGNGLPFQPGTKQTPFTSYSEKPAGYPSRLFDPSVEAFKAMVNSAMPATLAAAAKAVEGILNNQSLVVFFTWKKRRLLFAGDAQAGNWESWLYDLDQPMKDVSKEKVAVRAKDLLHTLDFYKVGHHGSTNATPMAVVDNLPEGVVSMCSTQIDTYGNPDKGTEVPRLPLVSALAKKGTFVRSDQYEAQLPPDKKTKKKPKAIAAADGTKAAKLKSKVGRWEVGDFWVDYFLD